jgi:CRISPR system Cascade subunit CasC
MTKEINDKESNMRRFLQLHILTSYPPSNLNRDDLGRPKTAVIGGTTRLRISSQSLKRAWRTSDVFREKFGTIELHGQTGLRTKRIGRDIYGKLVEGGIKEKEAIKWVRAIAEQFGKIKKETEEFPNNLDIEQLAFISPEEQSAIFALVDELIKTKKEPTEDQLKLLKAENSAADVALFGRMLASNPLHNIEAAVQVAHAFSVQKIQIEDDFFTAVDDLNRGEEDVGAGHMGDVEFASGVFYLYINIDRQLLANNLKGAGKESKELLENTIRAFVESAATIAPTGKQNTFGSRARAHYVLAELGNQQPRSLSLAYLEPVKNEMSIQSVKRLKDLRVDMDRAYGNCSDESNEMDVIAKTGSLKEILDFCVKE